MRIMTAHEAWLNTTRHIARKERSQILRNYISSIFKSFCIAYIACIIVLMAWIGLTFNPDNNKALTDYLSKPFIERITSRFK